MCVIRKNIAVQMDIAQNSSSPHIYTHKIICICGKQHISGHKYSITFYHFVSVGYLGRSMPAKVLYIKMGTF